MAQVWAVSTNKGGVLKTSLTTNLAALLSEKARVLIVDTDNQGNCMVSFGRNPDQADPTIYDLLLKNTTAKKAIVNVYKNIDMLPANDDMCFIDFDVIGNLKKYKAPFSLLKDALQPVQDDYDYILIDSPPNLGLVQGNILSAADRVLIPFQPEPFSMRSLVKILKAIKDFKEKHNPALSILGVVPTLVDSRTNVHSDILQECRKYGAQNGITVFKTVIPRTVRFAASIAYDGKPATLTSHRKDVPYYDELLQEVLGACQKDKTAI